MSTADKLNKVLETKQAIKQAIIDKGGTVGDVFAEYPTAIQNIQGGGSGTFKVPVGVKFGYSSVEEFPEDWDWSNYTNAADLSSLFQNCSSLTKAPKLNTSPSTTARMFYSNLKLSEIDLSGWDTSNTTDMSETFYTCQILPELNISNLDTSNCTNMKGLFAGCYELENITGIENLETNKNKDFSSMFSNCRKITCLPELDCSSNTTSASSSSSPVYNCYILRDLGGFKGFNKNLGFSNVYCLSYESLLNILNGLADGVSGLTLTLGQELVNQLSDDDITIATSKGWSVSPARTITSPIVVTSLGGWASTLHQLTFKTYDFSQYNRAWGTSSGSSFNNKNNLYVFEGDLSSTTDASYMFKYCSNLRYVTLTNTHNIINMNSMFSECKNLTTAPEFDTSSATDMSNMFYDTDITNIPHYNTSNVTNMRYMFYQCFNLKTADLSGWDLSKVEDVFHMFDMCPNLTSIKMTGDVSNITNADSFVSYGSSGTFYYNPAYDYSKIIAELPASWTAVPITE